MMEFDYKRAGSVAECLDLLAEFSGRVRVLAGGTDLMVDFRAHDKKFLGTEIVIDITHLNKLKTIQESGEEIVLGAGVTFAQLAEDPLIRKYAPFLGEAAFSVGSPQIRNTGTIGGSLGTASPASDPAPPLVAMDARVILLSRGEGGGEVNREITVSEFLAKPYRPDLRGGEMIRSVIFKKLNPQGGFSFVKLGRRKTLAIARMNTAVYMDMTSDQKAKDVRIVPGASFPSAVRVKSAEAMLEGQIPRAELHAAIGLKVAEEMVTVTGRRWSTPYKEPVIAVLVRRALNEAAGVETNE